MNKYILITDIGRDTDDTLALIILLYLHKINKIKLLAIAVSGAKLENRTNSVIFWLSKYSINNISVISSFNEEFVFSPIDIDERNNKIIKDIDSNVCILPYNEKKVNIENLKKNIDIYDNLISYFNNNNEFDINIIAIAPIRPLYNCLINNNKVIDRISNIYFQGNVYYEKKSIIPDIRGGGKGAYNFGNGFPNAEEIKNETKYVIDLFNKKYSKNDNNKLYFLGKNTAYLIEFNYKDFNFIDKNIAKLSIQKTLLFAKNLPDIFNMVFKNNINQKMRKKVIEKNMKNINKIIKNDNSKLNLYLKDLKNRLNLLEKKNIDKINYLNKELKIINTHINNIKENNENQYDSYYILFIQFMVDNNNINNKYTHDFLKTITKISNPYDLVLIYLVIYKNFFDFKQSKFLTKNDKIYNNTKHIQFNEKNKVILKKNMKNHMKKMLKKSLKII